MDKYLIDSEFDYFKSIIFPQLSPQQISSLERMVLTSNASCERFASKREANRIRQRRHRAKKRDTSVTERDRSVTRDSHAMNGNSSVESTDVSRLCHASKNGVYIYNTSIIDSSLTGSKIVKEVSKKVSKEGGMGETSVTRNVTEFDEFWKIYPRRVARQDAVRAYCKARKEGASKEEILGGVTALAKNLPEKVEFIPHAATWLNGKRWLDDPRHIAPKTTKLTKRQETILQHERTMDEFRKANGLKRPHTSEETNNTEAALGGPVIELFPTDAGITGSSASYGLPDGPLFGKGSG